MSKRISMGGAIAWVYAAGLVYVGGLGACSQPAGSASTTAPGEAMVASVGLAMTGGDFTGNSVYITATRLNYADGKYPCVSYAQGCFNFNDASGVPEPASCSECNGSDDFAHLCPSIDATSGAWTFTYAIWSNLDCTGTQINDGNHNFACYDISNIAAHNYPNETYAEWLAAGPSQNTIVCTSADTPKAFSFSSCEDLSVPEGDVILDCGCYSGFTAGGCTCPSFDQSKLPEACALTEQCLIDCER